MSIVRGRCVARNSRSLLLQRGGEQVRVELTQAFDEVAVGDLVEVANGEVRVVQRGRGARMKSLLDPRRQRAMAVRDRVETGIRDFFRARGFLEVRTPVLVPCPGTEPHIRPFGVGNAGWLQTSPEFAMKQLLVGGLERIFQMCPVFRDEPSAPTHRPEFTMLEWYRAWADDQDIMADTEALVATLAEQIHGRPSIPWQGAAISVAPPWPRLTVRDLFKEYAKVDLVIDDLEAACQRLGLGSASDDTWDDRYFRIWLGAIEPKLPADRAVFVTRYPASQAALAVVDRDSDGSRWARRFEAYAGGLELGNAFQELTCPAEQRSRFVADQSLRQRVDPTGPQPPLPEAFLAALEDGMPPAGGIAVGVDRLAMLLADEPDIGYLSWL